MFTGIIESKAKIVKKGKSLLVLERPSSFKDVRVGSSIAVSGVCLTIEGLTADLMTFHVVTETLQKSKLGSLIEGDTVNLERAMTADSRFDGHIVQGHVEGVGEVSLSDGGEIDVKIPKGLNKFCIQKGSITLDGVSLTIAKKKRDIITVALIPETLKRTTLGQLKEGDSVNVETDIFIRALLSSSRHREKILSRH